MSAPEVYEVPQPPVDPGDALAEDRRAGEALWRVAARRLVRNPAALLGAAIVVAFVLVALLAPVLAQHPAGALPGRADVRPTFIPGPSAAHPLGLDRYGADVLSQLIWGARSSLLIGVLSTLLGLAGGAALGLLAGAFGGWVDSVAMRLVDLMLAVPSLLLAVSIAAVAGQTPSAVVVAIGVVQVPVFARLLRGSMLAQRGQDYVLAARSLGLSRRTVTMSHVLPNSVSPVIVQATLLLATAVIEAAALSFLGLGGGSPTTAEWGRMLVAAQNELEIAPRLALWPGVCISVTALGFTLFGEALREALDPRSRRR
ncbi:MAG: ABC transporter permease [Cellulomonas iranensis]|uniref:Peptide/nickel transport system permease protein n=1 Tax=Cellulomonas iranensis TaxID=76862 RepID=A0ABU0GQ53_9CELL|nr:MULTISPECIES: ABC transporter permease [Cellulomonas]MBO9567486.1 ABC transporter permease [Cellulomonas iranensis]MDQ0426906.1 peptide/nickel transport system permease protein [Cellulomonas iranensis]TFH74504.1 ABC transporter permease [Cellulomonas sp. HD19AZ1]UCN16269.1 ABC transporter permease [Cellulomonas iranensis]